MQHKIKKEHAKGLKKGQTFQSEDGYFHSFEEYCDWGVLTEDGEIVEYTDVMQITFALDAEQLEAIKAYYGENTTDETIKEEINLIFSEKRGDVYTFIINNLSEGI